MKFKFGDIVILKKMRITKGGVWVSHSELDYLIGIYYKEAKSLYRNTHLVFVPKINKYITFYIDWIKKI